MSCKLNLMNQSGASCADKDPLQVCVGGISVGIVCMSLQGIHGVVRGCISRSVRTLSPETAFRARDSNAIIASNTITKKKTIKKPLYYLL
jgi:hypothetical protein